MTRRSVVVVAVLAGLVSCSGQRVCSCPSQPLPGVAVTIGPWVASHPQARQVQVCFADLCDVRGPTSSPVLNVGGAISNSRPHPLLLRISDGEGSVVLQREVPLSLHDTRVQLCCGGKGQTIYQGSATLGSNGQLTPG